MTSDRLLRGFVLVYLVAFFGYLFLPLVFMVAAGFNDSRFPTMLPWEGFTLKWYQNAFAYSDLNQAMWNSVTIALITMVLLLVLGAHLADLLAQFRIHHVADVRISHHCGVRRDVLQFVGTVGAPQGQGGNAVLYVSHSDPEIFEDEWPGQSTVDPESGVLTKLVVTASGQVVSKADLITGLPRSGENHGPNGMDFGPDGWLYLALGDHGCNVLRPEGDRLVLDGGGVLRCRLDGRDLHVFSTGLRNIYDVALDDELNVFVRDNENDGGDYMIRVCHSFHGADHGYPYLYYERPDEAMRPLADLGRGSSAGGTACLETAFPQEYRDSVLPPGAGARVSIEEASTLGWDRYVGPQGEITVKFNLPVARWTYRIEADANGGCTLTEAWDDRRGGVMKFLGTVASGVSDRETHNTDGMPRTLQRIKETAEGART